MRLNIHVNKEKIVEEGENIEEILEKCGYTIESVIILRNGSIVIEEDVVNEDTIEVVPVASGG
ncbi:MAG: MoaD/ThiS family protein [Theionarchaea archaeon]|nr:MoaD/ThiS family protein [Theionarchaea archaeon]